MMDSIRKQIIAAVVISQLVLAIGLTSAIVLYSRTQLLSAFNIMLEGRADSVLAAIHDSEDQSDALILDHDRLNIPARDLLEVKDEHGKLIWRSGNWQGAPAVVLNTHSPTFELIEGESSYRGIAINRTTIPEDEDGRPGPSRMVTIIYASSTHELDKGIFRIGLFASAASLLLLCLAGLVAAYGVSRGLLPLQKLAEEASRVSIRNWSFNPTPAVRTKQELSPLVGALETTLAGLQRAFDRERQSNADVAHELKTAVAILKSSLQLLSCQPPSNAEYTKGLEHALEDCDRLEALVTGTLSLARAQQWAEEGKSDDIQLVDLVNSCEQAVAHLQALAQSKGVKLECLGSGESAVKADPVDLQTVWANLLQNAIQHSPPGSTVSVRVGASEPDSALIVIEDAGTGIPAEHLAFVFERFRRGDPSRSRATGGFGLGLSICKAIIEAYGGHIDIESTDGAGTRVLVYLPALAAVSSSE